MTNALWHLYGVYAIYFYMLRYIYLIEGISMKIKEEYNYISRGRRVRTLEIYNGNRLRYYAYTFEKLNTNDDVWLPLFRADNYGMIDHIDRYDQRGVHISSEVVSRIDRNSFLMAVNSFGDNIISMKISDLW